jgi:Skp family chaperone for outer membrane proteins
MLMGTMKRFLLIALALTATSSFAQVAPPTSRGAAPPSAPPQAPLPPGAKIAFVNLQAIAQNSAEGKAANAKIESLVNKKRTELQANQKTPPQDAQRLQQEAQQEVQKLQMELNGEFQQRLVPILQKMAQEKHLSMLLSAQEAGLIWAEPGLDLTAEAIRRLDAATAAAPAAAAPKK